VGINLTICPCLSAPIGITASGGAVQSTRSKRIADMLNALEDSGQFLKFYLTVIKLNEIFVGRVCAQI
jgi:hypothetical protein